VDRLTKDAHFIPVKMTYSGAKLPELYMSRIMLKDFLVNIGAFAARRLRVYIRSLYNRFVADILVRIQLG
jgi:hypothetical protein